MTWSGIPEISPQETNLLEKAQENTLTTLSIHEDYTGAVWRCILVFCVVSLMHGRIKKNRKEKYYGLCIFSLWAGPWARALQPLHPDECH